MTEAETWAYLREYNATPKTCVECGQPCEEARWCYAIPTCYQCLPPPPVIVFRLGEPPFKPREADAT